MKKRYLLLLLTALLSTTQLQAKPGLGFLLGFRTGAGAMYSSQKVHNVSIIDAGGMPLPGTTDLRASYFAFTTPVKVEVLFSVGGFRFGYQFEYRAAFAYRRKIDYADQRAADYTQDYKVRPNISGHYLLLEYCWLKKRTYVGPSFAVGSFGGNLKDRVGGTKVKYNLGFDTRVCVNVGFNIEVTGKRTVFLIVPNYTFYNLRDKTNHENKGAYHALTLDLGFRFNMVRRR